MSGRAKKKNQLPEDSKSDAIIRPILRGRDIKKYGYDFADLWLINTHNGIKDRGLSPINIDHYPAVKMHLKQFIPQLEKRTDKGDTPYNLRNCAYMDDFNRQKIVWGEISDEPKFSIDLEGKYVNEATTFLMVGKSLLLLVGYLNSSLSKYLFSKIGTTTGVGTVRWKKYTIEQLPVPRLDKEEIKKYESNVLDLIHCINRGEDCRSQIITLDRMIYDTIGFTEEEILFIDSQ